MALFFPPSAQEMDSNGDPMNGAKLFFYEVGTSTKKNVYTDKALTIAHTNPVVADSSGRWDAIYMDGAYKVVLTVSTDTDPPVSATRTWDNISSGSDTSLLGATESITTTTAIDSTYQNKHLRCTGTINLNLLAVATAGEGFVFSVANDGTGLVTIDPNASEQINDTTTWVIPPGGSGICIASTTEWSFIGTMGIVQSLAEGDIFYANSNKQLTRLAKGTIGQILQQGSSTPSWGGMMASNGGVATGRYYSGFGYSGNTTGTQVVSANRHYACPFSIADADTFNRIGMEITTGSAGAARMGIYTWVDGVPGTLILDCGTVDVGSTALVEATISQSLSPGTYAVTAVFNSTPTVRSKSSQAIISNYFGEVGYAGSSDAPGSLYNSLAYGALPASFGGSLTYVNLGSTAPISLWMRKV